MAIWHYYNEKGDKITVSGKELKELAKLGKITPGTTIETEDGQTAPAIRVKGLTFAEAPPPPSVPVPPVEAISDPPPASVSSDAFNEALNAAKNNPAATKTETSTAEEQTAIIDQFCARYGNDVNAVDVKGETLLHKAIQEKVAIAQFLVSTGADVNAKDNIGMTALHKATYVGNVEVIKLLVAEGADVNVKSDHITPLHMAIASQQDNVEIAMFLVSNGADINARNKSGATALDMAKAQGSTAIAQYLSGISGASADTFDAQSDTYYYYDQGNVTGPTSLKILQICADVGTITQDDIIHLDTPNGRSVRACEVKGLTFPETTMIEQQEQRKAAMARQPKQEPPVLTQDMVEQMKACLIQGIVDNDEFMFSKAQFIINKTMGTQIDDPKQLIKPEDMGGIYLAALDEAIEHRLPAERGQSIRENGMNEKSKMLQTKLDVARRRKRNIGSVLRETSARFCWGPNERFSIYYTWKTKDGKEAYSFVDVESGDCSDFCDGKKLGTMQNHLDRN